MKVGLKPLLIGVLLLPTAARAEEVSLFKYDARGRLVKVVRTKTVPLASGGSCRPTPSAMATG